MRLWVIILALCLVGCFSVPQAAPSPPPLRPVLKKAILEQPGAIEAVKVASGEVVLAVDGPAKVVRSRGQLTSPRSPWVEFSCEGDQLVDTTVADRTSYTYGLVKEGTIVDEVRVEIPDRALATVHEPRFWVDKVHYTLSVLDGQRVVKRYPIAMGPGVERRKICYDNASTPEGRYQIRYLQPEATFYRAYDINYPNAVGRVRYDFARQHPSLSDVGIGGEIQIHGHGCHSNWTFGCMALRNDDMDELFSHPEFEEGMEVLITGRELAWDDLWLEDDSGLVRRVQKALGFSDQEVDGQVGPDTREALARFQKKKGLPVSCQIDRRTLKRLGLDAPAVGRPSF